MNESNTDTIQKSTVVFFKCLRPVRVSGSAAYCSYPDFEVLGGLVFGIRDIVFVSICGI